MNPIAILVKNFSERARQRRALVFRSNFLLDENTKILDLGSETGSNIHKVLHGTSVKQENTYIADIDLKPLEKGKDKFGYIPVLISESDKLPFDDHFFDIVYSSSVIEHVSIPKDKVWLLSSGKKFNKKALIRQKEFAFEIQRLGKQFFVQTPYKYFPIESHSWLPFLSWFPRRVQIYVLKLTNLFWVKKTQPDWHLLDKSEMASLFEDAQIVYERWFGLTKSIMAIKSLKNIRTK